MTLLAVLLLPQAPATAADFFPLVAGERRVYESKSDTKVTLIDEVGTKPEKFGDALAIPVIRKSRFNETLGTDYYRVDGPTVFLVGSADQRSADAKQPDGTVDFSKPRVKRTVLMSLTPPMPVFKYEGHLTTWFYGEVPLLTSAEDKDPIKRDQTSIKGTAKPGPPRTVLGRKVETLEVRAEVQYGEGNLAQAIVETSIYGRGIGLIESTRKETSPGGRVRETRTKLVAIDKKEGG